MASLIPITSIDTIFLINKAYDPFKSRWGHKSTAKINEFNAGVIFKNDPYTVNSMLWLVKKNRYARPSQEYINDQEVLSKVKSYSEEFDLNIWVGCNFNKQIRKVRYEDFSLVAAKINRSYHREYDTFD